MVLRCFGRTNLVNASIVEIIRESGSYDLGMKILAIMTINLLTFVWLLRKFIPFTRILCVTLLQISKLKHVNFIM